MDDCTLQTLGAGPSFCSKCDQPILPGDDIAMLAGRLVHHACATKALAFPTTEG